MRFLVTDSWVSILITILPFCCLLAVYALLFTPSKNKTEQALAAHLKIGDRVVTKGGVVGYIAKINEQSIILENYDGSLVELRPDAISEKIP